MRRSYKVTSLNQYCGTSVFTKDERNHLNIELCFDSKEECDKVYIDFYKKMNI